MRKILTVLLYISMTVQAQQFHQEFGNPRKPYVESVAVPNHPDRYYRRGQQAQLCVTAREGGWPKNIDMTAALTPAGCDSVRLQKSRRDDSTIDNDATTTQMHYLARLYRHTQEQRYRHAFHKAMQFILSGQYPNGGWPQFWPENRGYQAHITYNDDAMVHVLSLLRDVAERKAPYDGDLVDDSTRQAAATAFHRGIDCILATLDPLSLPKGDE